MTPIKPITKLSSKVLKFTSKRTGSVGLKNRISRDKWVQEVLLNLPTGIRILDAGAGELRYKPFCSHLRYVSQDFAQYDGKGDGISLQTEKWYSSNVDIVCDIVNIPEPSESFDAIMCVEVLEHLPNPIAALHELTRLLKPGGILILTAPFCALTHFSPYFYFTGFSYKFYEYWLTKLKYTITEIRFNGNYFEYLGQELRRIPEVSEKYVGKELSTINRILINLTLSFLDKFSKSQKASEEMLAFGLHVQAYKHH